VACLAGVITIALVSVVLRVAETRPPHSIVLVAGSLPLLVIVLQQAHDNDDHRPAVLIRTLALLRYV